MKFLRGNNAKIGWSALGSLSILLGTLPLLAGGFLLLNFYGPTTSVSFPLIRWVDSGVWFLRAWGLWGLGLASVLFSGYAIKRAHLSKVKNAILFITIATLSLLVLSSAQPVFSTIATTQTYNLSQFSCAAASGATYVIQTDSTSSKYYGFKVADCSLAYGGGGNAGGATGTSFSSVFNLIDTAVYNNAGGVISLSDGTFNVDATIFLKYQVSLIGQGKQASILKESNSVNLAFMLNFTTGTNARGTMEHLQFNGNKANNAGAGACLNLSNESGEVIFDLYITQCKTYGIQSDNTANTFALDQVQVDNSGSDGIHLALNTGAVRINQIYTNNNGGDGIYCSCTESFLDGIISDTNSGQGFDLVGATFSVFNGWSGGNSKNGMLLVGVTDSVISNMQFRSNGVAGGTNPDYYGIRMRGNVSQNVNDVISNNRIKETNSIGTPIRVEGTANNNVIEGNDFSASTIPTISYAISGLAAGYAGQNIVKNNIGHNPVGEPASNQYGYQGAGVTWNFQNIAQCGSAELVTFNLKSVGVGTISATIGIAATSVAQGTDSTYVVLTSGTLANDITTVTVLVPLYWYAGPNTVAANTNVGASSVCVDS